MDLNAAASAELPPITCRNSSSESVLSSPLQSLLCIRFLSSSFVADADSCRPLINDRPASVQRRNWRHQSGIPATIPDSRGVW
jgi:hypothetical protein